MDRDSHPLRRWLNQSGFSDKEFAKQIGISPSYLSQILSGTRAISLHLATKIEVATAGAVAPQISLVGRAEPAE